MKSHKPRNLQELWQTIEIVWKAAAAKLLQNLVHSMPNRCKEVIKSKGAPTSTREF